MTHISENLTSVLHEQIRCAEAMVDVLATENQALLQGDLELLSSAGAQKARLVEDLEKLESERRDLTEAIRSITSSATGAGIPQSMPQWHTLLELVASCKTMNERNGALVRARTDGVRATLRVLRSTEPAVYAPSGAESPTTSRRPLGTA